MLPEAALGRGPVGDGHGQLDLPLRALRVEIVEGVGRPGVAELEGDFDARVAALRAEYEVRMADIAATHSQVVARRIAESLIRGGNGALTVTDLLAKAASAPRLAPIRVDGGVLNGPTPAPGAATATASAAVTAPPSTNGSPAGASSGATAAHPVSPTAASATGSAAIAEAPVATEDDEDLAIEPYIESERCTTCNECTNLNAKLFAYNDARQAYIRDPRAGTYRELVLAAEKCPAGIIHPGTPLNPREKDLEKWIERAKAFL